MAMLQRFRMLALVAMICHSGLLLSMSIATGAEAVPAEHGKPSHGETMSGADSAGVASPLGGDPNMDQAPIFPQNAEHQAAMIRLFVFTLVLFGGFVFAARKMLWQPMIEALDQREAVVNQAHAEAEAARLGAEQLGTQHDAKMAEVRVKVQAMIAQARQEAEAEKARIIAEAEVQSRQLRESAIADIHAARDQALTQLEAAVESQVALATEHVVGHSMS